MDSAYDIHHRCAVLDAHVDIAPNFATLMVDPGVSAREQVDLPKMESGGVNGAFFIVYVPQRNRNQLSYSRVQQVAREKFDSIHRMAGQYPQRIQVATCVADFERNLSDGRLSAFIGIENGYAIGRSLECLTEFRARGARYMTLTHNGHNDIGDSAVALPELGDADVEHGGLSEFGREVVRQMNRAGMLVDISHSAKSTMLDAVRVSQSPVFASHSCARALVDHPRNLDDEQLDAIAKSGGVVHVTAVDAFVKQRPKEYRASIEAIRRSLGLGEWRSERTAPGALVTLLQQRIRDEVHARWPPATISDVVDHVDYIAERIGVEHVGLSSDFDGGGGVQGWEDSSQTTAVTAELLVRGYTEPEIGKIWSGNLLRILDAADALCARAC